VHKYLLVLFLLSVHAVACHKARHEALTGGATQTQLPSAVTLDIDLIKQDSNVWCWAAAGEMIMKFLGTDVMQCDQASYAPPTGQSTCCLPDPPSSCFHRGVPDFNFYGFDCLKDIKTELAANRPLGYYRHAIGGGNGHIVVIYGYECDDESTPCLLIRDPMGDWTAISHVDYVGGNDYDFEHYRTYYGLKKRSAPPVAANPAAPAALPVFAAVNADDRFREFLRQASVNIEGAARAKPDAKARFEELAARGMIQTSAAEKPRSDLDKAQLVDVLPSYSARVDELAAYSSDKPASELIRDYGSVVYTIRINGAPLSTVLLHRVDSSWKVSAYGTTLLAQQIDSALKALPPTPTASLRFLVNVPGLGVVFLGYLDGDGVIKLTPVKTNGMLEVGMHEVLPASEMFTKLHAAAVKFQ
jgi:hypothetical protein